MKTNGEYGDNGENGDSVSTTPLASPLPGPPDNDFVNFQLGEFYVPRF